MDPPRRHAKSRKPSTANEEFVENNQGKQKDKSLIVAGTQGALCRHDFIAQPAGQAGEAESLDALIARGVAHLTAYQDAAYALQYSEFVARVRARAYVRSSTALPRLVATKPP